jgi:hypothetical protein
LSEKRGVSEKMASHGGGVAAVPGEVMNIPLDKAGMKREILTIS